MKSILHGPNNKDILHNNVLHDLPLMKTTMSIEHDENGQGDAQGDRLDQKANQQTFIGPLKGLQILSFNFLGA